MGFGGEGARVSEFLLVRIQISNKKRWVGWGGGWSKFKKNNYESKFNTELVICFIKNPNLKKKTFSVGEGGAGRGGGCRGMGEGLE